MKAAERNFLFIIAGIAVVEFIINFFYEVGFFIYAIFIGIILVVMENEIQHTKEEKALIFLMIIPLCRLASLFLDVNFFWSTLIFYLLVISLVIYYSIKFWFRVRKNPFIGNPFYFLAVLLFSLTAWALAKYAFQVEFSGIVFLIPIIAYAEEIYFRGGFQNLTHAWFGQYSIIFTSLLYAIFSISHGFYFMLIAFLASLILSTLYYFTKNLYVSFALNIVLHVLAIIFYPVIFQ